MALGVLCCVVLCCVVLCCVVIKHSERSRHSRMHGSGQPHGISNYSFHFASHEGIFPLKYMYINMPSVQFRMVSRHSEKPICAPPNVAFETVPMFV